MELCIARQPIFSFNKRLYAYELLFRGNDKLSLESTEGNKATSILLSSTFLIEGIEKVTGSKPCFVNFPEKLLLKNIPAAFPKNRLVVEILEDVEPTPEIIAACKKLKQDGYTLALDDFVYHPRFDPLLELADIVKVDFLLTPVAEVHKMLYKMAKFDHLKLLAEKVETYDEFEQALKLGFHYFQGFFFSKPELIRIGELTSVKVNLIRLLAEVSQKKTTVKRLEEIVSVDVALTYKLLRYLNSAHFYLLEKVKSVARAISFLGEKRFRRFVLLVLISEVASDKPDELVKLAVVRAKFCELLAGQGAMKENSGELFLVGLFSVIDAMLDKPMKELMKRISLSQDVKTALVSRTGTYAAVLEAVECYERGEMRGCNCALQEAGIIPDGLGDLYLQALEYGDRLL
ncbi:MAG: HDOD domain-containing protein [Thermodesulfobacteriota bacterium]|nr:HDOD domain-containing protein [Thermodesulfobacteriota bacterium]